MALADDPVAAEEAGETRFREDHVDGATMGAGLGLTGSLPLV